MLAVKAGKDDLAKEALLRKQEYDGYAASFQKEFESQHASVEQLKDALRQLQAKIEEAGRKKNLLIARAKTRGGAEADPADHGLAVRQAPPSTPSTAWRRRWTRSRRRPTR